MNFPKVSFVVPCYKLGHLISECLSSILSQTYTNFEILVMDDQSPDDTAQVVSTFSDKRIKYIRNQENLGNLRNYNKGIELCRSEYIWLISADDYLRRPYILERYIKVMEANHKIGYAFCPGVSVIDGREAGVLPYSKYDEADRIIDGRRFLNRLLKSNFIVAASALVRRECYDNIGRFPLTLGMEWSGDWYLWCAFALTYDVAYFAEAMVCYRAHALSMTTTLAQQENLHRCSGGDLAVPLKIRSHARELGLKQVEDACLQAIANEYVQQCKSKKYQSSAWSLSLPAFEASLHENIHSEKERAYIRARVFDGIGDSLWAGGERSRAQASYLASAKIEPPAVKAYIKYLLVSLGVPGNHARTFGRYLRGSING
ncbi:glycosyltransferase family A protein [Edaphobacter paludis]|uniref:Glycosyltransferase family A protein n=1 Tax=Edaphobacter paludis TaxID=3035702 RepID=A0AAU7CVN1_9BACT